MMLDIGYYVVSSEVLEQGGLFDTEMSTVGFIRQESSIGLC